MVGSDRPSCTRDRGRHLSRDEWALTDETKCHRAQWVNEIAELGEPVTWAVYDEDEGMIPVFWDQHDAFVISRGLRVELDLHVWVSDE